MSRLFGMLTAAIMYLSVGTMISLTLIVGYCAANGYLSGEKITKILEVARGADSAPSVTTAAKEESLPEQPTLEEIEARRSIRNRNLELREQAVRTALDRLQAEQRKFAAEKTGYDGIKTAFEKHLAELHNGAIATGRENVRLIWENIKPKQAKEQMLQMIDAGEQTDVVAILTAMPVTKRAKIIGEFKTDEESQKMDAILRLIRQGAPDEKVIDTASQQLQEIKPKPAG